MSLMDARLEELRLLTQLDSAPFTVTPEQLTDERFRKLVVSCVMEFYVNDASSVPWKYYGPLRGEIRNAASGTPNILQEKLYEERWDTINRVLGGQDARLEISHKGRVRLAELRDSLRRGREREKFGTMWAGRHLERDLMIHLLEVTKDRPLSLLFFDMNGLKTLNDQYGYTIGDRAIERYLTVVASVLGAEECYRKNGEGDEVITLLPNTDAAPAEVHATRVLTQLLKERLTVDDLVIELRACCGIASIDSNQVTTNELLEQANTELRAAKKISKSHASLSVIGICGKTVNIPSR